MNVSTDGFTAHKGDEVCRPTDWVDILKFIFFNFILHAVTVKSYPGSSTVLRCLDIFTGVCLPLLGASRAILSIYWSPCGEPGDLKAALRAGAVCMVQESEDAYPEPGATYRHIRYIMEPGMAEVNKAVSQDADRAVEMYTNRAPLILIWLLLTIPEKKYILL